MHPQIGSYAMHRRTIWQRVLTGRKGKEMEIIWEGDCVLIVKEDGASSWNGIGDQIYHPVRRLTIRPRMFPTWSHLLTDSDLKSVLDLELSVEGRINKDSRERLLKTAKQLDGEMPRLINKKTLEDEKNRKQTKDDQEKERRQKVSEAAPNLLDALQEIIKCNRIQKARAIARTAVAKLAKETLIIDT